MSNRTVVATVGAVALIALCFGSAYLGTQLGAPAALPPSAYGARPVGGQANDRLDEVVRQNGYLEQRVRDLEQQVERAMALALENEARLDALARGETSAKPAPPAPVTPTPPPAPDDTSAEPDQASSELEFVEINIPEGGVSTAELDRLVRAQSAPFEDRATSALLKHRFELLSDATEKGIENRRAQAFADAQGLAVQSNLLFEDADRVRERMLEHMERMAREVGPYVRNGIEEADPGQVKERFEAVWKTLDSELQELLDEAQFQAVERALRPNRDSMRRVLDEHQKKRLDTK